MATSSRELAAWIVQGERGPAADTVVEYLTRIPLCTPDSFGSFPQTPTEFRRCVLLFDVVQTLRSRINELNNLGPEWSAIVLHWHELEHLLAAEDGLSVDRTILAPNTYLRLCELLDGAT
jgi:hypothetical protein